MSEPLVINGKHHCPHCRIGEQGLVALTYISLAGDHRYECPNCRGVFRCGHDHDWP